MPQINDDALQSQQLAMFPEAFENDNEYFGQNSYGLLEKSQILNFSQFESHPHSTRMESSFDEVFLTDFAPNCSVISVCTQEDRSYDAFSITDEILGESVDYFLDELSSKESPQEPMAELQALKNQKEEKLLQESLEVEQPQQEENADKEQGEQNSNDETKNIPKNYIKAIFTFILQNEDYMERLMSKLASTESDQLSRLTEFVRTEKKVKKYTIDRLKQLWTHPENGKAMRIISCHFLKKRSMGYIFSSKIEKKMSHIKHRYKLIRGIENPNDFSSIK